MILIAIILFLFIILVLKVRNYYKKERSLQLITSLPGESVLSSILHSLQITFERKELLHHVVAHTRKFGSPSRIILGTDIFVVLTRPEDYKFLLANVHGNYKTSVFKTFIFLGEGIIKISGTTHKIRRKMIHPLLSTKCLAEYVKYFDNYSNCCADIIEQKIDDHMFDIKPYIARYTIDIFLATFAGIQGTAYKGDHDKLLHWQDRLMQLGYSRMLKPWLHVEWIFNLSKNAEQTHIGSKILRDFIHGMLEKVMERNTLERNTEILEKRKYFLMEQLYDRVTNNEMSRQDFVDDIYNLYSGIQTTITHLTYYILLMMGIHLEIQEKLRKEILSTLGNDRIDAISLSQVEYLNMVIQETLRLFPIVPSISRQLTADMKLESCTLPEGCFVMVPIFAIHRDPKYWHDAEKFIPERFAPENSSSRQRYTYIPFGTGIRDCIGQRYAWLSISSIIVNLLRRYRFVTNIKMKDINVTSDALLRFQSGIKMSVFRV